jgi:hypothetical protein
MKYQGWDDLTAITSISTRAHGAARAATCIAERAGLFGCSEELGVRRLESREVEFAAVSGVSCEIDVHHDHIAHAQALFFQGGLDFFEAAHRLRLRVTVDGRRAG